MLPIFAYSPIIFAQNTAQFSFKSVDNIFTVKINAGSTLEKEFLIKNEDTTKSITIELEKNAYESDGKLPLPADWTSFPLGSEFWIEPSGSAKASLRIAVPADAISAQYLLSLHCKSKKNEKDIPNSGGITISPAIGIELTFNVNGGNGSADTNINQQNTLSPINKTDKINDLQRESPISNDQCNPCSNSICYFSIILLAIALLIFIINGYRTKKYS